MSAETTRSTELNGSLICPVKITPSDPRFPGRPTLASRWRAFEFGHREFVEAFVHPKLPGISVVFLHEADSMDTNMLEARARNPHAQQFLLSQLGNGVIIASSQLGYDETRNVTIPDEFDEARQDIEYIDYSPTTINTNLLATHMNRTQSQEVPLSQADADEMFRGILRHTREA